MNGFSAAGLIFVFFPSFIMGCFVLSKSKNSIGRLWAAFLFAVALWGFGMYQIGMSVNLSDSNFWWRIAEVGVILIPVLLTHFVVNFLQLKRRLLLTVFYGVTVFFLGCNLFTRCFIDRMYFAFNQFNYILATPVYTLFICIFVASVIYVLFLLIRAYRHSSGIIKSQIKYLILAFSVGFSGGITSYFPLYHINVYPVWNGTILVSVVMVTYAIMRYRFMDLREVARLLLIYFIDAVIVYAFFNILVAAYIHFWGGVWNSYAQLSGIFIAPAFVYGLFAFNQLIIRLIDKYFFYSLYDYRQTIIKLTSELNNYNDLDKIIDLIVDTIKSTMGLNRAGVLLINKEGKEIRYKIFKVIGFDITNGISLVKDNFLTRYLKKTAKPLVRDEMEFISKNSLTIAEKKSFLNLEKEMKHIEASLCLPLLSNKELKGIIVLGAKNSGDPFTKEDLELLSTLSNQAAIAIDNARLYSETKNFNKVLQQKVDEQTRELKDRAVHLEKLLKMREEFLDIASHQLKTPVSVIRSTISMFRDGSMDKLPKEQQQKFLDSIFFKTEKLNVIISDILRASEIETEEFYIDPKSSVPVKLEDLLKSVHEDLLPLAKKKGIKFELVLPTKALKPILTSGDFLEQALYNLADNAIKYTTKGFVRLVLRDQIDGAEIDVVDTGIGIPDVDKKKMFEKFSRAKNAVNMYTDGSGLGLFIAKQIIEAHQGAKLSFTSEEGKGTTFIAKFK